MDRHFPIERKSSQSVFFGALVKLAGNCITEVGKEKGRLGLGFPTGPFTTLEPQDQELGQLYLIQEYRETDFEVS